MDTNMSDQELKPCPFCGRANVAQGASGDQISVWCFCGARGPSVGFPENNIDPATPVRECRNLWNRRSPSRLSANDEGVTVKALEWEPVHGEGVETYQATCAFGFYRVFEDEDSAAGAIFVEFATHEKHFCMTHAISVDRVHDFDSAKAAAQADYNRRILSALSTKPEAHPETDWGPDVGAEVLPPYDFAYHTPKDGIPQQSNYTFGGKEFPPSDTQPTASGEQMEVVAWPNGCDRSVPEALRYLSKYDRPMGGEQRFNAAHLHQLAEEIERIAKQPLVTLEAANKALNDVRAERDAFKAGYNSAAKLTEAAEARVSELREVVREAVGFYEDAGLKAHADEARAALADQGAQT